MCASVEVFAVNNNDDVIIDDDEQDNEKEICGDYTLKDSEWLDSEKLIKNNMMIPL